MALFMDNDKAEDAWKDPGEDPDLLAIKSMMEEPPEESAELLKEQGNLALKQGRKHYKEALQFYSDAIRCKGSNQANNSIYYSNRAQVQLLLQNYGHAIADSRKAIELNQKNLKAYFRGAKAAFSLKNFRLAKEFCEGGLALEKENDEIKKMLVQSTVKIQEEESRKERGMKILNEGKILRDAILSRNLSLGNHQFKEITKGRKPYLDKSGLLHWPVVFLYGEVMASDIIEDFCETDLFVPHIEEMFGETAPKLEWDEKRNYSSKTVELYFQKNISKKLNNKELLLALLEDKAGLPEDFRAEIENLGEEDDKVDWTATGEKEWVKVDRQSSLGLVIAGPGHVVPGVPVFFVVARGTEFRKLFLSGAWSPP